MIAHTEALTKFTQQALNDSQQSLSLLNTEMCLMSNSVLQRGCAWIPLLPHKGAPEQLSKQNVVFIPDESLNVVPLLNHIKTQMPWVIQPQPRGLNKSVTWIMGLLILRNHHWFWDSLSSSTVFSCSITVLLLHLASNGVSGQTSHLHANETSCWPFRRENRIGAYNGRLSGSQWLGLHTSTVGA